jgi:hypothetical protein
VFPWNLFTWRQVIYYCLHLITLARSAHDLRFLNHLFITLGLNPFIAVSFNLLLLLVIFLNWFNRMLEKCVAIWKIIASTNRLIQLTLLLHSYQFLFLILILCIMASPIIRYFNIDRAPHFSHLLFFVSIEQVIWETKLCWVPTDYMLVWVRSRGKISLLILIWGRLVVTEVI